MNKTSRPDEAAVKKLEKVFAEQGARREKLIKDAIIHRALDPADLRWTSEWWGYGTEKMIALWNEHGERIEAMNGKGFFPTRLAPAGATSIKFVNPPQGSRNYINHVEASIRLDYVFAITGDRAYQLMSDLLFMLFYVSKQRIEWEASHKDGLWNRKYRKQRAGKVEAELAQMADELFERKEDEDRAEQSATVLKIKRVHEALDRLVRADPECADFTIGEARIPGSLKSNMRIPPKKPEPEQQLEPDYLAAAFAQICGLSNKAAAAKLNALGIKTLKGGKWHAETVRRHRKQFGR